MLYLILAAGFGISAVMLILAVWRGLVDSPKAGWKMAGLAVLVALVTVIVTSALLSLAVS